MDIHQLSIATIRALCIDGINKANSGHPGMALGSAPFMYTLFSRHLISDPRHPNFINRDRFVLSAGHASMLLYTMLHLAGYDVSIDDLKSFRQLGSRTPGHPEVGHTPGVDATTGPLGQGIAQAVGMAIAERTLAALYPDLDLINHYTYVLLGDGCLQEGVTQEAISFAGHQHLNKLIMIYDSNDVTLDGPLSMSFSEDVPLRFLSVGWNVLYVMDGNDINEIHKALKKAKKSADKPTLIIMKTTIGYGSKNQGTSKVHGAPLGIEDGASAKAKFGYEYPPFTVPSEVMKHLRETFGRRGKSSYNRYNRQLKAMKSQFPDKVAKFELGISRNISRVLDKVDIKFESSYKDATRNTSLYILEKLHEALPQLVGGSADVAKSVMTGVKGALDMSATHPEGRNINFGIREFAMGCIQNGMVLHGGLFTYVGVFLIFSDYMKPAIRVGALSHIPSIYLFSHDSVALGEDGPTHQPIDQLAMLRSIPNLNVMRPADANETWGAYKVALNSTSTPTAIVLSRQALPLMANVDADNVKKGAYVVSDASGKNIDLVLLATGSEVSLALTVKTKLEEQGYQIRVVSMPSMYLFEKQSLRYQKKLLGDNRNIVVTLEALSTFGWGKYAAHSIGIDTFGVSAPGPVAMNHFGFSVEAVVEKLLNILNS